MIESQRPLIVAIVLFLVWNAMSILWANELRRGTRIARGMAEAAGDIHRRRHLDPR